MKCPVCKKFTIRVKCFDEFQGDPTMGRMVTFVDDWEQECDCTLTHEQEDWVWDNAECDETTYSM